LWVFKMEESFSLVQTEFGCSFSKICMTHQLTSFSVKMHVGESNEVEIGIITMGNYKKSSVTTDEYICITDEYNVNSSVNRQNHRGT
jgi:hypothetical protein